MIKSKGAFSTRAIHAGEHRDSATNAHNTPIYQTATFSFETGEALVRAIKEPFDNFFYSRSGNPTTRSLEKKLADLEGSEACLATASGMAAVSIAVMVSAKAGDHILIDEDLFVVSRTFFEEDCAAMGIEASSVNFRDFEDIRKSIKPNTKVIFAETVTNSQNLISDMASLSRIAHEYDLRLIADNTFLGPYLFRPLELGADIVVHSATKYLSGHGDTVAGAICSSREVIGKARFKQDSFGQCLSPFNSWLILRGVRTLPLRMRKHSSNGLELATFLESHKNVEWIRYPGLNSHPQNDLATSQFVNGFGGMLTLKVCDGAKGMYRFTNALQLCDIGVSLGDLYTLVYPKPTIGNIIRVSVGCEDILDIISDFSQALDQI